MCAAASASAAAGARHWQAAARVTVTVRVTRRPGRVTVGSTPVRVTVTVPQASRSQCALEGLGALVRSFKFDAKCGRSWGRRGPQT
jgi:hypothetical protein